MTPAEIIREIIRKEGGWVNHKADRGGATNYGISLRYAKSRGLRFDLDRDGDVDADDIRLVTPATAFDAFMEDFYLAPGFDRCPVELQSQLTDYAVNSGPGQAIKSLQTTVNRLGDYALKTDGGLGPKTLSAVRLCCDFHGVRSVNNALVEERLWFFRDLCRRDPSQLVFMDGWRKRARSFWL